MTLPLSDLTEKQVAAIVVETLRLTGWGFYHTYRSSKSAPGYPDYSCWRDRHVWLELKSRRGKLSPAQRTVIGGMLAAGDEVYVIRETDLDDLAAVMRAKRDEVGWIYPFSGASMAFERLAAATHAEVEA